MKKLIIVLLCIDFISGCQTPDQHNNSETVSPVAGSIFMYPERIPLKDEGLFNAERGVIYVKENRNSENSNIISLEVYRFKANQNANPNALPIFFLHGGPGFGGLESSLRNPGIFEERWQPFLDVADVVVVSQRGIGPSKPTTTISIKLPQQSLDQPYDIEAAAKSLQDELSREKNAIESLGIDLNGYTIIEAAADIDDVRKALGYDKIVIWGGSFGSHWGMAVMRYYPEIVERAILRGMEGPDHTYDHPGHLMKVYERVAKEAESIPGLTEKIPEGGLVQALKTVISKHKENPVMVESGNYQVLFDDQTIKSLARGYSGGLTGWPASVIQLYYGNYKQAAEVLVRRFENNSRSFGTASYWMLDCGSGITPERLTEHKADPASEIFDTSWWYETGCEVWNSDLGNEFRQNFATEIPTVIVHGTWDTSTPYENALELLPYFKNSKFIPVIRGPHGSIRAAMSASEHFREGIFHYAATGNISNLPDTVTVEVDWVIPE